MLCWYDDRIRYDVVHVIVIFIMIHRSLLVPMSLAGVHHRIEWHSNHNSMHKNLRWEVSTRTENDSTNLKKVQQQLQQPQEAVGRRLIQKEKKTPHMTHSEFSSLPLSTSSSFVSSSISEMPNKLLLQRTTTDQNTIHQHINHRISTITNEPTLHNIKNKNDMMTTTKQQQDVIQLSLIEYINSLGDLAKHFILFQWNTSGILDHFSCSRSNWLSHDEIDTIFGQTRPSTYGTIALLFNLDTIKHIPWNIIPPVPVMVYTIPYNVGNIHPNDNDSTKKKDYYTNSKSNHNHGSSSRYILVPNPYDRRGYSEKAVEQVLQRVTSGNSRSSTTTPDNNDVAAHDATTSRRSLITFEEYQSRTNRIVWRGREVGEVGRQLLILLAESQNNNTIIMDDNNITSNRNMGEDVDNTNGSSSSSLPKQQQPKNHNENNRQQQQKQQQQQQIWLDVAFTVSGQEERLRNEIEANKTTNTTHNLCRHGHSSCEESTTSSNSKRIPKEIMASQYKYQIDIGGISGTSWDGLRWKMCGSGSLVLKVDTFAKDWWHDTIYPWVHYIPVQADLSNLYELYMWAEQNPIDAYTISVNGQQTCLQTFTKEYSVMIQKGIIQALPPTTSDHIIHETNMIFQYNLTGMTWEEQKQSSE